MITTRGSYEHEYSHTHWQLGLTIWRGRGGYRGVGVSAIEGVLLVTAPPGVGGAVPPAGDRAAVAAVPIAVEHVVLAVAHRVVQERCLAGCDGLARH